MASRIDTELAAIVTRAGVEAGRRFDRAQAARYPNDPEFRIVSPMESLGRAVRQFNDAFVEMGRQFAKGYQHG